MKISETVSYSASPETVYAMLTDVAFQERKCADAGALRQEVAVHDGDAGARVVTRRDLPTDSLPDFAKRVVGTTLTIVETYDWGPRATDGARDATLVVEASGAPVALRGTVSLRPGGSGSTLSVSGDLKAAIPLFGGKVEQAAAPAFVAGLRAEGRTGAAWLAENA